MVGHRSPTGEKFKAGAWQAARQKAALISSAFPGLAHHIAGRGVRRQSGFHRHKAGEHAGASYTCPDAAASRNRSAQGEEESHRRSFQTPGEMQDLALASRGRVVCGRGARVPCTLAKSGRACVAAGYTPSRLFLPPSERVAPPVITGVLKAGSRVGGDTLRRHASPSGVSFPLKRSCIAS